MLFYNFLPLREECPLRASDTFPFPASLPQNSEQVPTTSEWDNISMQEEMGACASHSHRDSNIGHFLQLSSPLVLTSEVSEGGCTRLLDLIWTLCRGNVSSAFQPRAWQAFTSIQVCALRHCKMGSGTGFLQTCTAWMRKETKGLDLCYHNRIKPIGNEAKKKIGVISCGRNGNVENNYEKGNKSGQKDHLSLVDTETVTFALCVRYVTNSATTTSINSSANLGIYVCY